MLAYDILCRTPDSSAMTHRRDSSGTLVEASHSDSLSSAADSREPAVSRRADTSDSIDQFEFDVSEFFMLGSPVALVLAYRQLCSEHNHTG